MSVLIVFSWSIFYLFAIFLLFSEIWEFLEVGLLFLILFHYSLVRGWLI